ncbi:MAG TPA: SAM-dependent methyltransferase [Candidatus Sulfotelmatobacter sp.]|nr:SAM-dependent methyltransferase [Candidatus Sulfotelmatobacter sp.]
MSTITVVGLGPGPLEQLTKEAESALLAADKIFFRTGSHPAYEWLKGMGKHVVCFDKLYALPWKESGEVYEFMVDALFKESELRGEATYALPGSPVFLEDTTKLLRERGGALGVAVRVIHGLSFVEEALAQLNVDFEEGLQVVLPWTHLEPGRFTRKLALLVCQIEAQRVPEDKVRVDLTMKWLLEAFPPEHPVTLIWTDGLPEYRTQTRRMALKDLAKEYGDAKYFASLYVPAVLD